MEANGPLSTGVGMCRRYEKRTQGRAQHGGREKGDSYRSVARILSVKQVFVEKGLVVVACDDLHNGRGWYPAYKKPGVTAILPLTIERTTHTEQACRNVVVSRLHEVQTSSQPGYHGDFCPTVEDLASACTAIERCGPTDESHVAWYGHNEAEMDYGYSTVLACKCLAYSCWDDRHNMFEACNYRRRSAS